MIIINNFCFSCCRHDHKSLTAEANARRPLSLLQYFPLILNIEHSDIASLSYDNFYEPFGKATLKFVTFLQSRNKISDGMYWQKQNLNTSERHQLLQLIYRPSQYLWYPYIQAVCLSRVRQIYVTFPNNGCSWNLKSVLLM